MDATMSMCSPEFLGFTQEGVRLSGLYTEWLAVHDPDDPRHWSNRGWGMDKQIQAMAEGWCLATRNGDFFTYEVIPYGERPQPSREHAVLFVMARAAQGSALHQTALVVCDLPHG